MNGPYSWGYEPVSGLTSYRVADASNNRIATCYSDTNARDATDALNEKWAAEQNSMSRMRDFPSPPIHIETVVSHPDANAPREVSKFAFELARAIFIDTSASSIERRNHLQTCGHTINRLLDKIAALETEVRRLTPAPVHDVEQYYPKDMTAEDAARILQDADDGGDCHVD